MKTRKLFWEKYLEYWSKYIFTDEVVFQRIKNKKQKLNSESKKYVIFAIKPKCKVNAWGDISINGKISRHFLIENMNSELYINIKKVQWNEKSWT